MEGAWGRVAMGRLAGYLACTEYGLSETELLELLMPTAQSSPAPLLLEHGHFNFSTFCRVRRSLGEQDRTALDTTVTCLFLRVPIGILIYCYFEVTVTIHSTSYSF